jgi:hypothetical protein
MRSPEASAALRQGRVGVILISEGMIAEAQLEEALASPRGAI